LQNLAAGGSSTPQPAQRLATAAPHSLQNFARSGIAWPHAEQVIGASL
jgi:hypothetical protein